MKTVKQSLTLFIFIIQPSSVLGPLWDHLTVVWIFKEFCFKIARFPFAGEFTHLKCHTPGPELCFV